jgi:formylglycine-generating enzyme required for sulfatase activity/energy-coupling factor transporter ATP-binding protein EcfA2
VSNKDSKIIKIVILSANPLDSNLLRNEKEVSTILSAIDSSRFSSHFHSIPWLATDASGIRRSLLKYEPAIVHFTGHGTQTGKLVLEKNSGKRQLVNAISLSELFSNFSDHIKCVILTSCYSETLANNISKYIDYTIGFHEEITYEASIIFSEAFYNAIGSGKDIQKAYKIAVSDMKMNDFELDGIPKLFIKKGLTKHYSLISDESQQLSSFYKMPHPTPYKFLDSFSREDADIFFGREREINEIVTKLSYLKTLILYGKSGSGKTSLINAGLIPRLEQNLFNPIYVRIYSNPLIVTQEAIKKSQNVKIQNSFALKTIVDKIYKKNNQKIILFFDQFEELYTSYSNAELQVKEFTEQLIYTVQNSSNELTVVFSLREDFLHEMHDIEQQLQINHNNKYRIHNLSEKNAAEAILLPLASFTDIQTDENIEKYIINELKNIDDAVYPPQLQIVCSKLFESCYKNDNKISFSLLHSLGDVKRILSQYVNDILEELDYRERTVARVILVAMVTSHRTKIPISKEMLFNEIKLKEKNGTTIENSFSYLVKMRLINTTGDNYYELAHEYIINQVYTWIEVGELETKRAKELVEREYLNFKFANSIMNIECYKLICAEAKNLDLFPDQIFFLLKVGLRYNLGINEWISKIQNNKGKIIEILLKELENVDIDIRRNALITLASITEDENHFARITDDLNKYGNPNVLNEIKYNHVSIKFRNVFENAVRRRWFKNMLEIPAGKFIMGSDEEEYNWIRNNLFEIPESWVSRERPKHKVYLPKYFIDRYPVTNAEYKEFDRNHEFKKGLENHPVTNVSLNDAISFTKWLGKRIPTEAEWEKAARGIDDRRFPWGNEFDVKKCNSSESGIGMTTPVDKYSTGQSPFGCYDMSGNVFEWTISHCKPYPYSQNKRTRQETKGRSEEQYIKYRVLKGGAFSYNLTLMRVSMRYAYYSDDHRASSVGFRCVCDTI